MKLIDGDELRELFDANTWQDDMMRFTIDSMPELDPVRQDEWIPCSERLPVQPLDDVIVTIERDERFVSSDYLYNGKWVKHGNDVLAWMPLPKLYKEGE